jgi:FixJ family two-component response regulator
MVAVIDDDEAVLESLRMILDRYDFEVRTPTSADFLANKDRENARCVVGDVRLQTCPASRLSCKNASQPCQLY